jgi:hypothetical protein
MHHLPAKEGFMKQDDKFSALVTECYKNNLQKKGFELETYRNETALSTTTPPLGCVEFMKNTFHPNHSMERLFW